MMRVQIAFFILIAILTLISVSVYLLSKNQIHKFIKYIPALVAALGIVVVYIKMQFFSEGFEEIYYVITLIFLSVVFGVALLTAIIIEIIQRLK